MRALARVDLGAIERNVARLRRAAGADLCAVVKADGYGHGATPAARAALAGGATWLAVATAREAASLRADGVDARLLVMGALGGDEVRTALDAGAEIGVWDPEFAAELPDSARVHVKLDTGMGRLGTRDVQVADALADALATRGMLAGAWTHFATSDEEGDAFLGEQLERFRAWAGPLRERHPGVLLHASNSAATLREPAAAFDFVRCGIAIYGLDPFGADPAARDLEPALSLLSWVAAVKPVAPGESAGYGRRFVASEPTVLATVPIGYGDGVRRGLTNNAEVLVRGERRALLGTVSMDNVTVAGEGLQVGDEVVLIGAQGDERVLAEEWARRLDTINYEITCGLTARVPREYV